MGLQLHPSVVQFTEFFFDSFTLHDLSFDLSLHDLSFDLSLRHLSFSPSQSQQPAFKLATFSELNQSINQINLLALSLKLS